MLPDSKVSCSLESVLATLCGPLGTQTCRFNSRAAETLPATCRGIQGEVGHLWTPQVMNLWVCAAHGTTGRVSSTCVEGQGMWGAVVSCALWWPVDGL